MNVKKTVKKVEKKKIELTNATVEILSKIERLLYEMNIVLFETKDILEHKIGYEQLKTQEVIKEFAKTVNYIDRDVRKLTEIKIFNECLKQTESIITMGPVKEVY